MNRLSLFIGIDHPSYASSETGLTRVPIPSISMATRSPFLRKTGGTRQEVPRKPDALRGTRQDDRSLQQRRSFTQKADQGGDVENHIRGGRILQKTVIERGFDLEGIGIRDFVGGDQAGTERTERIE